jgi:hypothetical protein
MITYERQLTPGESTDLQEKLQENSRQQRKACWYLVGWPLSAIVIATLLKASLWVCLGWLTLGLLISFGINSKYYRKRKQIQSLLQKGTVTVFNIQAGKYIWLPDFEGEGEHYLFQLDNDQLLLIGGEEYLHEEGFPHEQNEIISGFSADDELVYFDIIAGGQAVEPISRIDDLDKIYLLNQLALTDYDHYSTGTGRLEDLLTK